VIKKQFAWFLILVTTLSALAQEQSDELAAARMEIRPLFSEMQAAANAHDAEKHLSFYVREPNLLFVINDEAIVGHDALLAKQRQWWQNGKTDVVYKLVGEPDFKLAAPGLVMVTYFLTSRRTLPDGKTRNTKFGISALWQKRPEGWRIIHAHESTVRQDVERVSLTFNHVALSVTDADRSAEFYARVLNLSEIRKTTRTEGVRWLSLGEGKELHLISPPYYRGDAVKINKAVHVALTTDRFDEFLKQLDADGVAYGDWQGTAGKVQVRSDGVRQIFFQDPDGYWIEVNSTDKR
jgi:catechol 2,3-dioxygenase-like lactoylglutathione lyase family enzyme/ketosteroid isomerase-like protein